MTHDLKRPLFFNVQQSKRPAIGIVSQLELARIERTTHHIRHGDGTDDAAWLNEERSPRPSSLPTTSVALPLVRSPRPEKPTYTPSPSKTPQYFRWKRPPASPGCKIPSKPGAPKTGPSAPSPRSNLTRNSSDNESSRPLALAARRSSHSLKLSDASSQLDEYAAMMFQTETSPELSSWEQPSLFHYSDPLSVALSTPKSPLCSALFSDLPSTPQTPSRTGANYGGTSLDIRATPTSSSAVTRLDALSPVIALSGSVGIALETQPSSLLEQQQQQSQQQQVGSPSSPLSAASLESNASLPAVERESSLFESPDRGVTPELSVTGETESSSDMPESPIVLKMTQSRQPQEKVISQHILRGAFLRKYLHVTNITRKLKETEQMLRSSALKAGVASRVALSPSRRGTLLAKSPSRAASIDSEESDESSPVDKPAPVLRRLSSIDKAINKTVKRIRRLSGVESSPEQQQQQQQPTAPAVDMKSKYASLRAISENQPSKQDAKVVSEASTSALWDGDDESDDNPTSAYLGAGEVKMDPSSAHMLRICQHVMAKRAIKSFLRQEMSVIHQIECALRDDESVQHHRATTPARSGSRGGSTSANQFTDDGGSESSGSGSSRHPVKSMSADVVEAVAGYLREGDQHMTVDELFFAALDAEKRKLWKRAILVTSACVVIDREFLQVVLLRARCCRRLGLWTQAVKDLGHALLLRPEEPRLFLLRAFLAVKMADLESALADVNRALLLQPKSTDALLLRADIFHRQCNIGASLQDLTAVLGLDPRCWRAYYDRATIRIRAVEGDEQCLSYHWEHMKYEELLVSIIEDYVNALRKGCKMVEVVETVGDLTVRLLEFTGDASVLRQVVQSLAHLLQVLSPDYRGSFYMRSGSLLEKPLAGDAPLTTMERELLVAAIHAQRGRLFVLFGDRASALAEFDRAVVSEYHYPVAHFYRGAFATTTTTFTAAKDDADYKSNITHLSRSIALDPTIAGAYTVRGALHLRELKFNSALQDFKAAVTTDPTLYEVWLQIALIYLNHYHDSDECIKACSSALTNDSCLARALYLRAEAFTRQGNLVAALKDYGRLTVAEPDDRWAKLMRGRLLLQLKLARPALYSFILFMEQGSASGDKRAPMLCGMAFKILARFQKAVTEFQRAVQLNPTCENLVLLSESFHSLGDTENSLRVSEKVISADPGSFKGYVRRAQLLVSVGQFALAMAEYDKALFLAPKEGRVYYERGIVHMQLYLRWRVAFELNFGGHKKKCKRSPFEPQLTAIDVELALGAEAMNDEPTVRKMMKASFAGSVSDFCKCIRLEPLLADPYVDRAELYALSEEYEKAFRDFETALERNPKCVRAHVNLGVLKCQFSAFAFAIDDFDKAIKHDTKLALVFFNRGVAYHKLSLWEQADKSFSACIELSGQGRHIDAHRNRAIARCQLGEFAGALSDFEEVRQSAPDDDQLHGGLGYVLLQLGRYEDAAKSFATYGRLSRDTFGDSGNAYFNLATQSPVHLSRTAHQQHLKTALRFYVRAARIHPSNLDVRLNIANCLRKQGEFARAITQCDAIVAIKPLHHAALESKAFALYQLQRFEDAIECMNAAIRACVASSSSLGNIFFAFASDSLHRNALERKTIVSRDSSSRGGGAHSLASPASPPPAPPKPSTATSSTPSTATATTEVLDLRMPASASEIVVSGSSKQLLSLYMLNRGVMYERVNDFELARQNFCDAIHFDTLSVSAQICMGTLNLLEARYPEALTNFATALAVEPNSAIAHINSGVAYLCVNDLELALVHLDAALALAPTCSYAYANKAVVLARRGDTAQAEHNFKRAIEELPSQKEYYLARGKIIAQQKRLQDAMVDFSTALFLGYEGKL